MTEETVAEFLGSFRENKEVVYLDMTGTLLTYCRSYGVGFRSCTYNELMELASRDSIGRIRRKGGGEYAL